MKTTITLEYILAVKCRRGSLRVCESCDGENNKSELLWMKVSSCVFMRPSESNNARRPLLELTIISELLVPDIRVVYVQL